MNKQVFMLECTKVNPDGNITRLYDRLSTDIQHLMEFAKNDVNVELQWEVLPTGVIVSGSNNLQFKIYTKRIYN